MDVRYFLTDIKSNTGHRSCIKTVGSVEEAAEYIRSIRPSRLFGDHCTVYQGEKIVAYLYYSQILKSTR